MTNSKKQILSIILTLGLFLPTISSAAIRLNLVYPEFGGLDLNYDQDLNQIIGWFYYFVVAISGFSAFFMFVWGGFEWMTSAGSPGKMGEAKDRITSAVLGLVLILASYLILRLINPELTILQLPSL